eukprot:Platyproteum_vivax@DN5274_c0_g1_i1.p1
MQATPQLATTCLKKKMMRPFTSTPRFQGPKERCPTSNCTMRCLSISYAALFHKVVRVAGGLQEMGLQKGDTVLLYMPNSVEVVVTMLACAWLGAIHAAVFGGFPAKELITRIEGAEPKVIVFSSCGLEVNKTLPYWNIVQEALKGSSWKPQTVVVHQRKEFLADVSCSNWGSYTPVDYQKLLTSTPVEAVPVESNHPLYLLYTSGTTGNPKGVIRTHAGQMLGGRFAFEYCYGVHPKETYFAASDIGWVLSHSAMVYGPFTRGCASIIYEGKPINTPDAGALWRVCEEYNAACAFVSPTALRGIRHEDPDALLLKDKDLSKLRSMFVAGERLDGPTHEWISGHLGIPVCDNWWQTELGWPALCYAQNMGGPCPPTRKGSCGRVVPGWDLHIVRPDGTNCEAEELGSLVIKLPMPPGSIHSVWAGDEAFKQSYLEKFPGYYDSGDSAYVDACGYVHIMARTDDIINVSAHRLSTCVMEDALNHHPAVSEAAVMAIHDDLRGQVPIGVVILKKDANLTQEEVRKQLVAKVRKDVGAIACFKIVAFVDRLPRTRSGKILRRTIAAIANGQEYVLPTTIEHVETLDEVTLALKEQCKLPYQHETHFEGETDVVEE